MRRLLFVLFVLASPVLWSCSEKDKAAVRDLTVPDVRIFYPYDAAPTVFVVSDSIDTYFAARDIGLDGQPTLPTKVELWFVQPDDTVRVRIGEVSQPISAEQVPENLRPWVKVPAGWSLYMRRWYTGPTPLPPIGSPIVSGTIVQLYAVAYDEAGNVGRSPDVIRVSVFNKGDDLVPPVPVFTVSPPGGTTAVTFAFDASATTDSINRVNQISVRWDFDGNPENGWDIDWDRGAKADQQQQWQFRTPRSYNVVMEAHNTYLPAVARSFSRFVIVSPIGGNPRPPEPDNYADVPAGRYVLGDSSYVLDGRTYPADSLEHPIHDITISSAYRIEKTEVTNRLYLEYVRKAILGDTASVTYSEGAIYGRDREHPEFRDVYLVLSRSRIFFDLDRRSFAVQSGFEEHPVTGATWAGASAYALFYGLRLPTEAEWEAAARGGNGELNYPFFGGLELTRTEGPRRVNYAGSRSVGDPFPGTTTPVRFYDGQVYQGFQTIDTPSVFGLYDMAGNVAEWVNDWLGLEGYRATDNIDPQGEPDGIYRVVRGGSFQLSRAGVRCTGRMGLPPGESYITVGFRTAYISTTTNPGP